MPVGPELLLRRGKFDFPNAVEHASNSHHTPPPQTDAVRLAPLQGQDVSRSAGWTERKETASISCERF